MGRKVGAAAAALLLFAAGCTPGVDVTLPPLDASASREAPALVVAVEHARGFEAPDRVVRGADAGAAHAMGGYLRAPVEGPGSGEALIVWLVLLPVALPVSAVYGAVAAHPAEEVDAAVAAFQAVAADPAYLASIDRRVADVVAEDPAASWACLAAASAVAEPEPPCAGAGPAARLELRPVFTLKAPADYNPEVRLTAEIVAVLSAPPAAPDDAPEILLEAKWAYRETLGEFFDLAADDGAPLRRRLDAVLDGFATRIADDLYRAPAPSTFRRRDFGPGVSLPVLPEGTVLRIAQGRDLPLPTTHGVVRSKARECWIEAVDGQATGQGSDTPEFGRRVIVRAGPAQLDMACLVYPGSVNERTERRSIALTVEPGAAYETDGSTYAKLAPPRGS